MQCGVAGAEVAADLDRRRAGRGGDGAVVAVGGRVRRTGHRHTRGQVVGERPTGLGGEVVRVGDGQRQLRRLADADGVVGERLVELRRRVEDADVVDGVVVAAAARLVVGQAHADRAAGEQDRVVGRVPADAHAVDDGPARIRARVDRVVGDRYRRRPVHQEEAQPRVSDVAAHGPGIDREGDEPSTGGQRQRGDGLQRGGRRRRSGAAGRDVAHHLVVVAAAENGAHRPRDRADVRGVGARRAAGRARRAVERRDDPVAVRPAQPGRVRGVGHRRRRRSGVGRETLPERRVRDVLEVLAEDDRRRPRDPGTARRGARRRGPGDADRDGESRDCSSPSCPHRPDVTHRQVSSASAAALHPRAVLQNDTRSRNLACKLTGARSAHEPPSFSVTSIGLKDSPLASSLCRLASAFSAYSLV